MSDQPTDEALYEFSIYPFSTDPVFQEGLHSIVSTSQDRSPEELENVIGQAKAFYFTRTTGHWISWEKYVDWRQSHPLPLPTTPLEGPKQVTPTTGVQTLEASVSPQLTFQQITELIKSGRTDLIPNNKVIPEALHPDPPSYSSRPARKKPWEASAAESLLRAHGGIVDARKD